MKIEIATENLSGEREITTLDANHIFLDSNGTLGISLNDKNKTLLQVNPVNDPNILYVEIR